MNSVIPKHAAASDFEFSLEYDWNGLGIATRFSCQNAFGKRILSVLVKDGKSGLQNNGAGVEIFVDEMDGAAGEFYAIFESLALRFQSGERREQRRMDIEDAIWKLCDKKRRQQAHVSGEADEIDFVLIEYGSDLAVVDFAFQSFRRNHPRSNAARLGALDAGGAFAIADDDGAVS